MGSTGPSADAFVATWNTANTSTGSSATNEIKLPLVSGGTYNFTVEWGDGNTDVITAWNQSEVTHTYLSSGVYEIICTPNVVGGLTGWSFLNTGDRLKILNVSQCGQLTLLNNVSGGYFFGCSNMTWTATDSLKTPGIVNMNNAFLNCSVFNGVLNFSDTSAFANLRQMLSQCLLFNRDVIISAAGISSCYQLLQGSTAFNSNISITSSTTVDCFQIITQCVNFNGSFFVSNPSILTQGLFNCDAFRGSLAGLTINACNLTNMMQNATGMSTASYDATLIAWAAQLPWTGTAVHFGGSKYTAGGAAETARNAITASGVTITDGGPA